MALDKSCQICKLDLQGTSQPFDLRMKENYCAPLTFHPHYYFYCMEDVFLSLFFPTMSLSSFCSENIISNFFPCLFFFSLQATSHFLNLEISNILRLLSYSVPSCYTSPASAAGRFCQIILLRVMSEIP